MGLRRAGVDRSPALWRIIGWAMLVAAIAGVVAGVVESRWHYRYQRSIENFSFDNPIYAVTITGTGSGFKQERGPLDALWVVMRTRDGSSARLDLDVSSGRCRLTGPDFQNIPLSETWGRGAIVQAAATLGVDAAAGAGPRQVDGVLLMSDAVLSGDEADRDVPGFRGSLAFSGGGWGSKGSDAITRTVVTIASVAFALGAWALWRFVKPNTAAPLDDLQRSAGFVRPAANANGSCGRCEYRLDGLSEPICPECGSDFRRVGIKVPGMTLDPFLAQRRWAWVICVILVTGGLLTAFWKDLRWRSGVLQGQLLPFTPSMRDNWRPAAAFVIKMKYTRSGYFWPLASDAATMEFWPVQGPTRMITNGVPDSVGPSGVSIDLKQRRMDGRFSQCHVNGLGAAGSPPQILPIDAQTFGRAMDAAGLGITEPMRSRHATELAALARELDDRPIGPNGGMYFEGGYHAFNGRGSGSGSGSQISLLQTAAVGIAALIWYAGDRRLRRR